MAAPKLFTTLTEPHPHYSCYTTQGDYRVLCEICSKTIAFQGKKDLDRHLQTGFHRTVAALKPDLRDIKADTAAIRAAIVAKPQLSTSQVPLVAA